jgi:TM2 domain-containing membrane protein YozV
MALFPHLVTKIKPTGPILSFFLFILNVFFPGLGTMVNQCVGVGQFSWKGFMVGVLQLILAPLIIGWIWSIWWGVEMMKRSGCF